MKTPKHLKSRFKYFHNLQKSNVPSPWELKATFGVGGLTDVGYQDATDLLLVISSGQGRGVFDCLSGERVARDRSEDYHFDMQSLMADSIAPLTQREIRVAGLHGGGLAKGTRDGWSLEHDPVKWPLTNVYLFGGFQSLTWKKPDEAESVTLLEKGVDLRVIGFSPTGKSFVIGTGSDLYVFSRA